MNWHYFRPCLYFLFYLSICLWSFYINSSITAMKANGRLTATFHMNMKQRTELQSPTSVVSTGTKCLQPVDTKFGRNVL